MKKIFKLTKQELFKKTKKLILATVILFPFLSCSFFESPSGTVELLDVYTRNEVEYIDTYSFYTFGTSSSEKGISKTKQVTVSYICTTVKITNTSDKNIYNTTINIQAKAGERTYYKTISLDVTIEPGNSIFIPIEIEKNTKDLKAVDSKNDADWDIDSIKIISVSWR